MELSETEANGHLTLGQFQAHMERMAQMLVKKADDSTERLSNEIAQMRERIIDLEKHVENQGVVIESMRDEINVRDERICVLESTVQMMTRERNLPYLVFDGSAVPPPPANEPWREDVASTVVDMVKESLPAVSVSKGDIEEAYRVARGKKIVCKFMRKGRGSPRDQIYQKRVSLGKDENGQRIANAKQLYVNEMLTDGAQHAFYELRKAKKAGRIHTVFTRQCRIYVRMIEHGEAILVNDHKDLDRILHGAQH